jgi:hypothetical protein
VNYEEEIRFNKIERVNNLYFRFVSKPKSTGEYINPIIVKGDSVASVIKGELVSKSNYITELENSIIQLQSDIGVTPFVRVEKYIPEQWKDKVSIIYDMYSYSQMTNNELKQASMKLYNDKVKKLIEEKIILTKFGIILGNINPEEDYTLPEGLADKLGIR